MQKNEINDKKKIFDIKLEMEKEKYRKHNIDSKKTMIYGLKQSHKYKQSFNLFSFLYKKWLKRHTKEINLKKKRKEKKQKKWANITIKFIIII